MAREGQVARWTPVLKDSRSERGQPWVPEREVVEQPCEGRQRSEWPVSLLHSYAWPGGPQTAVTPVITLGPLWELTAEVPQWPRPNLRGGMGCKGSRFQGPQWLAKVLGAPLPGVRGPSLPEAGFGGSGETAGGRRAPAWPRPPPGQGPTRPPIFWSGGLVGAGPPGGGGAPGFCCSPGHSLQAGLIALLKGVLKHRACPHFWAGVGPTQAWEEVWGRGVFHSTWPWWPPSRPPWEMRVDSGLVSF